MHQPSPRARVHSAKVVSCFTCHIWSSTSPFTLLTALFTLHTSHFTLHTSHFTLHTPRFTLHTQHFTLHSPHFTLLTTFFTLHTSHFTLHTALFTSHTSHCTLHTPHFISSELFSPYPSSSLLIWSLLTCHLSFHESLPSTTTKELACAVRQPGPCARALCEAVAVLLSKKMTCARPRRNATPSKHFPHTSHCTLHTPHSALHTCTSSQLISSELFSSNFMSSHMSAKFFLVIFMSTTCTKYFPVLHCDRKLAQRKLLHTASSFAEKLLHTASFLNKLARRKLLHTASSFAEKLLHTASFLSREAFTHRSFYTKRAFTQRSFYTQQAFTHSKLSHTASVYTQNPYTECFYTWQAFTHHTQQAF